MLSHCVLLHDFLGFALMACAALEKRKVLAETVWLLQVVRRGEDEQTVTACLDEAVAGQTHLTSLSSHNTQ